MSNNEDFDGPIIQLPCQIDPDLLVRAIRMADALRDVSNWRMDYSSGPNRIDGYIYVGPTLGDNPYDHANNIWSHLCQLAEALGIEVPDIGDYNNGQEKS